MQDDIVSTIEQLVIETLLDDGFCEDKAKNHGVNVADKIVWLFGGELAYVKKNNEVRESIKERNARIVQEWNLTKNCKELSRKYGLAQAVIYEIVRKGNPVDTTQDLFKTHCPDDNEQQKQEKERYITLIDEFNALKWQLKTLVTRICNSDPNSQKAIDSIKNIEPTAKKIADLQQQISNNIV
jgi:Mor family transcriptional regulator